MRQVTGLAETYSTARETLEAESAAAAAAAGDGKTEPSSGKNGTSAHTLEGHRQTMAGVVPRLYQLLSNAVEADDARARSQEMSGGNGSPGAGVAVATEGIRAVLHGKPWLWVGDAFVPADQVRQERSKKTAQTASLVWTASSVVCPASPGRPASKQQ